MRLTSLGHRTDLIFARYSGTVTDRGDYLLVQTPSNPGYHWGNYLVFDRSPRPGDLESWRRVFDREFDYYEEPHHYAFTWDTPQPEPGDIREFLDAGFESDPIVVLTAARLDPPAHLDASVRIRTLQTDEEWEMAVRLQTLCSDPKYVDARYEGFKRTQMAGYRRMSAAGMGHWFGAFLGDRLVGNLGIFFEDDVARYQNVGTHPEFRRRGVCATLVYEAGRFALRSFGVDRLVILADPDHQAARIYESVGFGKCETNYALSWWRRQGSVNGGGAGVVALAEGRAPETSAFTPAFAGVDAAEDRAAVRRVRRPGRPLRQVRCDRCPSRCGCRA